MTRRADRTTVAFQEYDLQNALDAQRRLGSAKIRAVPIPNLYEDTNSQAIYPANVEAPKQLIRLQRTYLIVSFLLHDDRYRSPSLATRVR